jgi:hypothetical protein
MFQTQNAAGCPKSGYWQVMKAAKDCDFGAPEERA